MHTIIAALAALIIANTPVSTILPPPWVAPEPTATPTLIWSKTPIAPVATSNPSPTPRLGEPVMRVWVWLPVVTAAKMPPEG
jgi:hypothetical protein